MKRNECKTKLMALLMQHATSNSETFVIVTETWMSEEQNWNINLSAEHNFLHKNRSHQTGAAKGGGIGISIPKKINFKRRREFELADTKFLKLCGWS